MTDQAAPETPLAAPTMPQEAPSTGEAPKAGEKPKRKPGAHRAARDAARAARIAAAQLEQAEEEAKRVAIAGPLAAPTVASAPIEPVRAHAPYPRPLSTDAPGWRAFLAEVARGTPMAVAAPLHGVSNRAVQLLRQRDPAVDDEIEAARALGAQSYVARMAVSDDWKREAWLLERFLPKSFHLPTKVTGVSAEDGGAPVESRVEITLADARSLARGVVVRTLPPALPDTPTDVSRE